jgi:predicted  nucleic acid-binding Zn-ribbon protein
VEQAVVKQLDSLIRLSELDSEIAVLKKQLERIPRTVAEKREEFRSAERALEIAEEELGALQKEHRQAEGALDGHLEKIRKLNDQTGLVKTNKEYQTLLGEIETLKSQQDGYEESILELMEKTGEVENKIRSVKEDVARERAEFEKEEAKLLAEGEALKRELEKRESFREEILPAIERENMETYQRVKALRGDAVAEVREELCLGCRVSVPPQKYADVIMKESIQTCSHCHRILYSLRSAWEEKEEG